VSSRQALVQAGLELIDAKGLAALNMRSLAARVGISAMTPYTYFASKAELRDAITEHALAALARDAGSSGPWEREIKAAMRALHDVLVAHPGILDLIGDRSSRTAMAGLRRDLVERLRDAGLSETDAADGLRTLSAYVVGYVLLTRNGQGHESFERGLDMVIAQLRP